MAQPAGRPGAIGVAGKYRAYSCSSPLICCADGVSILARLVWICVSLNVSPKTAAKLIMCSGYLPINDSEVSSTENYNQNSWLRWIFFVIGTLPAAIKLVSFSGMPWTKAWGLMFLFSYLVVEGLVFLSTIDSPEPPTSIPEALGHSKIRWELDINEAHRTKVTSILEHQIFLNLFCFMLAFIVQIFLLGWIMYDVWWAPQLEPLLSPDVYRVCCEMQAFVSWICPISFTLWALTMAASYWRPALRRYGRPWIISTYFFLSVVATTGNALNMERPSMIIKDDKTPEKSLYNSIGVLELWAGSIYVLYRLVVMVFKRVPRVAKALLVAPASHASVDTGLQDKPLTEDSIDDRGVQWLFFFCVNLSFCLLWYATKYDPTGTTNPAWTDVFG